MLGDGSQLMERQSQAARYWKAGRGAGGSRARERERRRESRMHGERGREGGGLRRSASVCWGVAASGRQGRRATSGERIGCAARGQKLPPGLRSVDAAAAAAAGAWFAASPPSATRCASRRPFRLTERPRHFPFEYSRTLLNEAQNGGP